MCVCVASLGLKRVKKLSAAARTNIYNGSEKRGAFDKVFYISSVEHTVIKVMENIEKVKMHSKYLRWLV